MRLFLAVAAGAPLTAALSTRLDAVRDAVPVRWTRPEGWHLTLQFLGEWPEARLNSLLDSVDGVDPGESWVLRPAGLGAFPDLRRPRVLFLQLADDGQSAALALRLRTAVAATWPDGPQDTKAFRPHLTLARVGEPLSRESLNALRELDLSGIPDIPVEGFALVVSELRPDGARYREAAFWRMRKKGE